MSEEVKDKNNYTEPRLRDHEEKQTPFTVFTRGSRFLLISVLCLIGFWSTCSNPIYFPALPTLEKYFHTNPSRMNISVLSYLVLQGISPSISSNLADSFGRRPVLTFSLVIFIVACIGISQTKAFWLLIVLRCLQAAGIAPVISISSGISGDVCTRENRGGFIGITSGFQLLGNGFGAIIGAALMNSFKSWRSIFIFLMIGGIVTFVITLVLLPETGRNVVGNGSIEPQSWFHRSPIIYFPKFKNRLNNATSTLIPSRKFDIFASFKILFQIKVFLILLPAGIQFTIWTMVLTSMSNVLENKYGYSVLHVGLIYLPQGIGCLVSALGTGRFLNYYYKRRKAAYELQYSGFSDSEKPKFNLLRSRFDVCLVPGILAIVGEVIFGWCIQYKEPAISIIISTVLVSTSVSSFVSIATTILVDLFPEHSSTSTSCMNLVRCLLAALFVGVLDKMISCMGYGGTFTFMAGIGVLADCGLIVMVFQYTKSLSNPSV